MWLFEVRGKTTEGGERKVRDAWMPEEVTDDVHKYSRERGLPTAEPWVRVDTLGPPVGARGRCGGPAETGDERWRHLSSHDLRSGRVTEYRWKDVPRRIVQDRSNASKDILDKHYDRRNEPEKAEQRTDYLPDL